LFDTILVPVDENVISLRAVTTASKLAEQLAGRVVLLHVIEPLPPYTSQVALQLPEGELEQAISEHGRKVLEGFSARVPGEVEHEAILRHSRQSIWREILDVAAEKNVDLVIIGTHGREGVARAFLGSVAERVARHAEVPVMLVR
jgi:nucleotide-binding universal stress UspA family protein